MTISTEQTFKEILDLECEKIPLARLAFLREEFRNRLYAQVVARFHALADKGFTKAHLARRIGKSPEQVIRWLGAPGNWTLDTASDLLTGMRTVPVIQTDDLANYLAPTTEDDIAKTIATLTAESSNKQREEKPSSSFAPRPSGPPKPQPGLSK
jgi:hypothetical protein